MKTQKKDSRQELRRRIFRTQDFGSYIVIDFAPTPLRTKIARLLICLRGWIRR